MKFKTIYKTTVIASILFFFSSCALVLKKYEPTKMSSEQQEKLFREQAMRDSIANDSTSMADLKWNEVFTDPKLQVLIEEALKNNYDLKNAVLNIAQAEAGFKQSKQAFYPTVNFSTQMTHNRASQESLNFPSSININLQTTNFQLGFTTSWELDIWGKLLSTKRATYASYLQLGATKRALQTSLIANIANNYFALMALDRQLKIAEETVNIRQKTVETLKKLAEAGRVTGADLAQSEASLQAAMVIIPELKQSIRKTENQLCVLMGKMPESIERSVLEEQQFNIKLDQGIPFLLLKNRPDVEASELAFRQAFENTNVARTQFYPTLSISAGSIGISALITNNLFGNSFFYNIIGGLLQPIFNRGQIRANFKISKAKQEIALNNFGKTLLDAGVEVSNALFAYETVSQKQASRTLQIVALQKAVDFNMKLLEFSERTTYTDVLTSEQNLLNTQLLQVNDSLEKYQAVIELYRALGGGWK